MEAQLYIESQSVFGILSLIAISSHSQYILRTDIPPIWQCLVAWSDNVGSGTIGSLRSDVVDQVSYIIAYIKIALKLYRLHGLWPIWQCQSDRKADLTISDRVAYIIVHIKVALILYGLSPIWRHIGSPRQIWQCQIGSMRVAIALPAYYHHQVIIIICRNLHTYFLI